MARSAEVLASSTSFSTSDGIVLADEATGIWAKLLTAEPMNIMRTATQAIKRGKLDKIKSSYSFKGKCDPRATPESQATAFVYCAVSDGSSMIWKLQEPKTHLRLPHEFFRCQLNAYLKHTLKRLTFPLNLLRGY